MKIMQAPLRRAALAATTLMFGAVLVACGSGSSSGSSTPTSSAHLGGSVMGGRQPVVGASVYVVEASFSLGSGHGEVPAQLIGSTTTASDGSWNVSALSPTPAAGQLVYVVAEGGQPTPGVNNSQAVFMTVAGTWGSPGFPNNVNLNELTTVATAAVLQSDITETLCSNLTSDTSTPGTCPLINESGGSPGATAELASTANNLGILVDVTTGKASTTLSSASTSSPLYATLTQLNSLGNILASCVNSSGGLSGDGSACGNLYQSAGPLSPLSQTTDNLGLTAVAVSPDDDHIVGVGPNNTLVTYSVGSNGVLSASLWGGGGSGSGSPAGVAFSPNGQFVFVADSSGLLLSYSLGGDGSLSNVSTAYYGTPTGVAASPDGSHLFVTDPASGLIETYTTDGSGNLSASPVSSVVDGNDAQNIAVSPDGSHVFVVDYDGFSGDIDTYSADSNGALTLVSQMTATDPQSIAVSPDGSYALVANDNSLATYSIDSNGALTLAEADEVTGSAAAFSPDGNHVFVENVNIGSYDVGAGDTLIGTGDTLQAALNLARNSGNTSTLFAEMPPLPVYSPVAGSAPADWNVDDQSYHYLFASESNDVATYVVSSNSGTVLGGLSSVADGNQPGSVAVAQDGQHVFVTDSNGINTYSVGLNGALTLASSVTDGNLPVSVAVSPDGSQVLVGDNGYVGAPDDGIICIYTVGANGALTLASSTGEGFKIYGVAWTPDGSNIDVVNSSTGYLIWGFGSTGAAAGADANIPQGIAASPDGSHVFVADYNGDIATYTYTSSDIGGTWTYSLTYASRVTDIDNDHGVAVSPDGSHVFVAATGADLGHIATYSVDGNGALTLSSSMADGNGPTGVAISP